MAKTSKKKKAPQSARQAPSRLAKPKTGSVSKSHKSPAQRAGKPRATKPARAAGKKAVPAKKMQANKRVQAKKPPAKSASAKSASSKVALAKSLKATAKPAIKAVATPVVPHKGNAKRGTVQVLVAKKTTIIKTATLKMPVSHLEPDYESTRPAVTTNLNRKKNQIGLGVRELEHFAQMLLAKRRELVGDMSSMEREALRTGSASNLSTLPVHMADMGTDNYEQEFTLTLVEKDRNLLREINHALGKIQNGTFGVCEGTGLPISKARLEVQPWARYSIEYARQKEKNGMGVRTM